MNTALHSFADIFNTYLTENDEAIELQKIVIPIIQRDYAQGRKDPEIDRVRARFLDALYDAIEDKPITLDFIYGDIDEKGVMTPLDGQQRLTTLFLLHWYAAKKGHVSEEASFLKNFDYETRYSARDFCKELIEFEPSFDGKISEEIINQAWFPLDWKSDPTISSMLVMIDAIDEKFSREQNLWNKLNSRTITFYFLPIRDMGLTDELYIKMNSRGKPLTQFEHFKAELERCIKKVDEKTAKRVISKVDLDWTNMLWRYRDSGTGIPEDDIIDDEFLKYFHFICDILCYRKGESPQGKSANEFDLLQDWFEGERAFVLGNVSVLESFFDCWCSIEGYESPTEFLESVLSKTHEFGKIVIDRRYKVDIFEDCLHNYADKSGRIRTFPLGCIVLLYAIIAFLQNQGSITRDDFIRRLRIINNLIKNSEDEISDRTERNRIPAILQQIDSIMLAGIINDKIDNSFNVNQLKEEESKQQYLKEHPDMANSLFALEDHYLLYGQISIIGLEHLGLARRFESLFKCDWDKIDCALMSIGDYGQQERNGWRYQYGSSRIQQAWEQLFHKSSNSGFANTSSILLSLLSKAEAFSNELLESISDSFVKMCEEAKALPWRYYYIKYKTFRPGRFGKIAFFNRKEEPYVSVVLQTKSYMSENSYIPYLKEADGEYLSRDDCGKFLQYEDCYINSNNDSYEMLDDDSDNIIDTIDIKQNEEGHDIIDRVTVLKRFIKKNITEIE